MNRWKEIKLILKIFAWIQSSWNVFCQFILNDFKIEENIWKLLSYFLAWLLTVFPGIANLTCLFVEIVFSKFLSTRLYIYVIINTYLRAFPY